MSCSCIKGAEWHPVVTALDTRTFVYDDNSVWNTTAPYKVPEKHKVTIETPEGDTYTLEINAAGRTYITPQDLGYQKCLSDGVYCIQAFSCLNCNTGDWGDRKFTKNFLIIPQLDCKIKNLMTESPEKAVEFFGKKMQLEANASLGLLEMTRTLYEDLEEEVSVHDCSNCC